MGCELLSCLALLPDDPQGPGVHWKRFIECHFFHRWPYEGGNSCRYHPDLERPNVMHPHKKQNHAPVTNKKPVSRKTTIFPLKSNDFIDKGRKLYDELVRRLVKLMDKYMDEWAYENTLEMLQNPPANSTEKLFSIAITILSQYAVLEEDKPVSNALPMQYITHIEDMVEHQTHMCHDMLMGLVGNKDRILGFFAEFKL